MNVVFFGSGPFGLPALERLAGSPGDRGGLRLIVTRPERPAGRGQKSTPTPIAAAAARLGLPVEAPESANAPAFLARLASLQPDLFLVADFGEFLGKAFRDAPRLGAFNLHGSLLPRYRGAAPIVHALKNGETRTGVTLFRIEKRMDSGPIVAAEEIAIDSQETAGELEARLAVLAADLLEKVLPQFISGNAAERPQDEHLATFAPKILKEHGAIDWRADATTIANLVRAMNPWPGAYSHLTRAASSGEAERVKILRVRPVPDLEPAPQREGSGSIKPGEICGDGQRDGLKEGQKSLRVACGAGRIEVLEIQRAGRSALNIVEFLRGWKAQPGDFFTVK